jgi:hypothetical protein
MQVIIEGRGSVRKSPAEEYTGLTWPCEIITPGYHAGSRGKVCPYGFPKSVRLVTILAALSDVIVMA